MGDVTIREYTPADRPAIRRICFNTGLMGNSIAPQYADQESFADMFTAYYTDHEPQNVFVAVKEGAVVGYAMAALDTRKAYGPFRYLLRHALLRGVCLRPGTAGFYVRSTLDSIADLFAKHKKPKIDLDRYPSHNHINMLPEVRGGGVAIDLFFTMTDRLREQGSVGMHAGTLANNKVVAEWIIRKVGGTMLGEPYPIPGLRGPAGERMQVQSFVLDMRNYLPGAWKKAKSEKTSAQSASTART
jgi:hypothetical protein